MRYPRARRTVVQTSLSVALLIVGSLAPVAVPPVAADHSESQASVGGELACDVFSEIPTGHCLEWEHESPEGVHTWQVTDERTTSAGGSSMKANPELRVEETWDGDALISVRIAGHLTASSEGGGKARSNAEYEIDWLPQGASYRLTGTLSGGGEGDGLIISTGDATVEFECAQLAETEPYVVELEMAAGAGEQLTIQKLEPVNATLQGSQFDCELDLTMNASAGSNRAAGGESGNFTMDVELTLTRDGPAPSPTPETCSISGLVTDTDGIARPGHGLAGVRVELLRTAAEGGGPVSQPVAARDDGTYCLHVPAAFAPGAAVLRATLIDFAHQPSLFKTRHVGSEDSVSVDRAIDASHFGRTDVDIDFMPTTERPWLADVATIHYESERFMSWVLDDLGLAPGLVGPVDILTGAERTNYAFDTKLAQIAEIRTPFSARSAADSICPENCEWHELAHHVGDAIGLALTFEEPACAGRTPHGGWLNGSTCDSLAEGFASFLAALASLDIDAGRGPGYATPDYSTFGSFEDNGLFPWSSTQAAGGERRYHEDHATAQLLWDLADPVGDEHEFLWSEGDASDINPLEVYDRVDLGGRNFVHLLAASQADTVMGLYDFLAASPSVPADLKARDPGFPEGLAQDITPLQEAFLLHRFYPVPASIDPNETPRYRFGDTIGRTDRPGTAGAALVERRDAEQVQGSEIQLVNDGVTPATFTIDVKYPATASRWEVVVAPGSERLVHVEVPPPWPGIVGQGAPLPACGATEHRLVTITVSAPGTPPAAMDSCKWVHALATTTTGAVMSYAAGANGTGTGSPAGQSGAAGGSETTILIVVAAVAVILAVGGLLVFRRRAGAGTPPGQ